MSVAQEKGAGNCGPLPFGAAAEPFMGWRLTSRRMVVKACVYVIIPDSRERC